MFYAHLLMSKRGPLAKIWLAAHWDKKLTKAHVFECNLETTIESIISPKVTIALRTSGHLLLGVVRIYHRKAKYLLADCNEALIKMKMAFRPGTVDLPEDNLEATYNAITLPEEFHDFDFKLPDLNAIDVAEHFTLNQSRAEDITLREDYGGGHLHGGNFGEDVEIFRQSNLFDDNLTMSVSSLFPEHSSASFTGDREVMNEDREVFKHDGFGDEGTVGDMLDNLLNAEQSVLIEDILDMSKDISLSPVPLEGAIESDVLAPAPAAEKETVINETTLLSNEEDGFALEPVDVTAPTEKKKSKRKRKLLVDSEKELSSSTMRKQLSDFLDTVTTVDIAPPTRKLMIWKETGGVEKLVSSPSQILIHVKLQMLFTRCLMPHCISNNNPEELEPEKEEMRKQDIMEMPVLEEPSYLQESVLADTSMATEAEPSVIDFQNGIDQEVNKAGEISDPIESEQDSEERRWNKRTHHMLNMLRNIHNTGVMSFSLLELCKDNNRKQASAKFYSFLVLKKQLAIELSQSAPYADVIATPGPRFNII